MTRAARGRVENLCFYAKAILHARLRLSQPLECLAVLVSPLNNRADTGGILLDLCIESVRICICVHLCVEFNL